MDQEFQNESSLLLPQEGDSATEEKGTQNAALAPPRIDADGSGAISKEEFIRPLTRWIHESKTAPRFVKYNVDRSLQAQARWPPLALFLNHHLDSVKRS